MTLRLIPACLALCAALAACGGGGGGGGGSANQGVASFANAKSALCGDISGLEAVFWDFMNGAPRGDLPPTAFTIPFQIDFTRSPYQNSKSLLLGFSVPQGWAASDAVDTSGFAIQPTVAGADLIRNDNQAVWRYMISAQVTGPFTAAAILDADINAGRSFFGNPAPVSEQCVINAQQNGILGPESVAARIVRMGDKTIMARVHVTIVPGVSAFYDGFLVAARTSEMPQLIYDIYTPMITQLYGGGSSSRTPACSDGIDNDGDGLTDYPNDPQCTNPSDNSEAT